MNLTRRDFVKNFLWMSGLLLLPAASGRKGWAREKTWQPAYRKLEEKGGLTERIEEAYALFEECELCPRRCGVNRLRGERGFCRAPSQPVVYSAHPHFGEEMPLVGRRGSGTIFFSNCNLRCVFCQNWPIAHEGKGKKITDAEIAAMMVKLQEKGCHNINLVTPTHVMPNILNAVRIALGQGLKIPLVYNTSGYERLEIVRILDGIVDIYLPDVKYMDPAMAETYSSGAVDYPEVTMTAVKEMSRQVGELVKDSRQIARRGLMIRHLVMPNRIAGTKKFVRWVAKDISRSTYVNIMAQYRVEYRAYDFPKIARAITREEFLEAMTWAEEAGLRNLDVHSLVVKDAYRR